MISARALALISIVGPSLSCPSGNGGSGPGDTADTPGDQVGDTASAGDAGSGDAFQPSGFTWENLNLVMRLVRATNPDWCGDELVYQKRRDDAVFPYRSDVYRISPFAISPQEVCLTCDITALDGAQHKGTPDWGPNCEFIVFTVTNAYASGLIEEDPSFAINSDLWIVDRDGMNAHPFLEHLRSGAAALHPHFSPDGNFIFWGERVEPTPNPAVFCPAAVEPGLHKPGCANPWQGWVLAVGTVSRVDIPTVTFTLDGLPAFFGDSQADENLRGMYEPGEVDMTGSDLLLHYSHTRCGQDGQPVTACGYAYMGRDLDIVFDTTTKTFGTPTVFHEGDGVWSEKLSWADDGQTYSLSTSAHIAWNYFNAADDFFNLELEIHILEGSGQPPERLTFFNTPEQLAEAAVALAQPSCERVLASDHAWGNGGAYFASNASTQCGSSLIPTLMVYRLINPP